MTEFEVFRDAAGEYRFRLKANNGEIVAQSEGYKQFESCVDTIKMMKAETGEAKIQLQL
jgi:uncharacterized protein